MSKIKRTCVLCGQKYEYCNHCGPTEPIPWKNVFDEENCHDIWKILNSYDGGLIDKDDASAQLSKLDLSRKSQYNERWTKLVNELMPVKKRTTKKTEEKEKSEKVESVEKDQKPKKTTRKNSRTKTKDEI